jgi:PAS domain S-box-containing protein
MTEPHFRPKLPGPHHGLFELDPTLDDISTLVYVKDCDLRIVSANLAFCRVIGVNRDELIGRTTDPFLGDAGPESARIDRQVISSGLPRLGVVESYPAPDGLHWAVTDKAPIVGPDGRVVGLVGTSIDITSYKKAEDALRTREAQLTFLADNMADIVWSTDLEFHTTYVSPSVERVLGFTPEERMKQSLAEMATPESVQQVQTELQRQLQLEAISTVTRDRTLTINVEYYHKNGSKVWLETVIRAIRDDTGSLIGMIGVSRDITERRKVEKALRESEEKFRQLFDRSIVPISLISQDGRLLEANDAWFHLLGYSRDDIPTFNAACLFPSPEMRGEFVERLLRSGSLPNDESRLRTKDGRLIDVLRSISVRYNPDGSVFGFQSVLRDITELNRTRDELVASHEQLRKLALRIQEVREEERTTIARELHDHFSQELTALKFDLDSLRRSIAPGADSGLKRLDAITGLIDRMSLELRQVITEMRPGMLDDLGLCAALDWQAGQFSERTGITCNLILTANDTNLPPSVSTALFRTFQELLTNVARHAGANYVDASFISNGDYVYLAVVDDGRGITDEELHNSASLGILGIQERIRACGGTVTFRGEPGRGTTVTVKVPQRTDTADGRQARLNLD